MDEIGIIVVYRCAGRQDGKIFIRRFERIEDFRSWSAVCGAQIISTKIVPLNELYLVK